MELIIDIDEKKYNTVKSYPKDWDEWTLNAIKNGRPLKKGHWMKKVIETENDGIRIFYECSECGVNQLFEEHYCPNCGVKMVEPQKSEEK